MTENVYQSKIIKKLEKMFPGCIVLKTDTQHIQGLPDLLILWREYWAALEVKLFESANRQANQNYYIERLDNMSFAAYIYPENEKKVLNALQQAFKPAGRTRVSKP